MSIPQPRERFATLVGYIQTQRKAVANELAIGRWEGEAAARELVGRIKALDDLMGEVQNIAGPNFHYDGDDLT